MLRTLVLIFSCVCVAVVLSEGAAVLLLWQRGLLTEQNIREIRLVLSGQVSVEPGPAAEITDRPDVAYDAVQTARALKILDLQTRESSLAALQQQILDAQQRIQQQQDAFRGEQQAFEKRLSELQTQLGDAGTEQARGILLALPADQAAEKLMSLSLDEGVRLLKGIPEKSTAKILKELVGNEEKLERGRQIFRAIYMGEPQQSLVDEAQTRLQPAVETTARIPDTPSAEEPR